MTTNRPTSLLPFDPSLSTVQILSATNFAPIGFAFPPDGRTREATTLDLQYAWKEIRRWHRSFCVLCDDAEDVDILHNYHLMFEALFIQLDEHSSDNIDRAARACLQPLRKWAGTVIRTSQEYEDLMRNVRASIFSLYQVIKSDEGSGLTSSQLAIVKANLEEVAIFIRIKTCPTEPTEVPTLQYQPESTSSDVHKMTQKSSKSLIGKLRSLFKRK